MFDLSSSELLLYGGLIIMIAAVISAVLCISVFIFSGRKLKDKLEREYGKI